MIAPDRSAASNGPRDGRTRGWLSRRPPRNWVVLALLGIAVLVVAGPSVVGSLLAEEPPEPEIESVEILDAGCYDEVRPWGMSSTGGVYVGVVNDTSPDTEVSAAIRRVSRSEATVASYRVHVETHNTSLEEDECPGRIVYRVEFDAPYPDAADAMRVERYVDDAFSGCGGSTSGPDTGCWSLHEDRPTHWSNGSVTEPE